jgi:tetratricopeptide (TPR) repeat protein
VSTSRFLGVLCFSVMLYAQAPNSGPQHALTSGEFAPDIFPGVPSLLPDWPARPAAQPISGVVSLRELQHPVPKKALRAAYQAQQFSNAHKSTQAIAMLEKAVRIDPSFRDAHCNLGVEYARAGRLTDARAEFQKALDIGPPAAPIYADLALTSVAAREFDQALAFARKALELDPDDGAAQILLKASAH